MKGTFPFLLFTLLLISQAVNYYCDYLIKNNFPFSVAQSMSRKTVQLPWATVYVQRRMCDIMTGETSVGVALGMACVSSWWAHSWIHMTEICWSRQSFHSVSLIRLAMRTTYHPAVCYKYIRKTICEFIDTCTSISELTIGSVRQFSSK